MGSMAHISKPLQYITFSNKELTTSLFRNKRFVLNEMFQRNASKFFYFSFQATSRFSVMNALVYVDIR